MQKNTSRGFLFCVATKNLRRLARSGDGVFVEYGIVLKYCRRQISGAPFMAFAPTSTGAAFIQAFGAVAYSSGNLMTRSPKIKGRGNNE